MSNHKGIPTIGARGIQFRSRIEAQWAYIFEMLEWNWDYEPIDLQGYIPDFIIKFDDANEILIEIKGDTKIWKEEVYTPHKDKIIKSGWKGQFGILGGAYKEGSAESWINIGKVFNGGWYQDDLVLRKNNKNNKWSLGGDKESVQETYQYHTIQMEFSKLWVEAKNKVQWKGIQNKEERREQRKEKMQSFIENRKEQHTPTFSQLCENNIVLNNEIILPQLNDDIVSSLLDKFSIGLELFVENNIRYIKDVIDNDGSNLTIASLASKIFKDWTYYDTKRKAWFYCDLNNVWCEAKKPIILKHLIQNILTRIFKIYISKLGENHKHFPLGYKCFQEIIEDQYIIKATKIIKSLKVTSFMDSIMKYEVLYIKENFYDDYIDSKPYLYAFKNKVYDFRTNELRYIKPNDYIMTNTGYDYPEDIEDKNTEFINKYFDTLFLNNSEIKDYILDSCCSTLNGEKREQYFNIHTGCGSNSKTTFSGLYESVLGGYACEVSPETFTKPKKSANDTGELYKAKGKRWVFTNEPEPDTGKLQTALLKRISDETGRKIIARALYGNPVEIPITFQLNIFCNNKPELSSVDGGITRRLRVIEWKMKFVENPDPNNTYQAPLDTELMTKIITDDVRNAFVRMLLDRWETRVSAFKLIPVPDEINAASADFVDDNSRVSGFIKSNYELTNNEEDKIGYDKLYTHFVGSCRYSKVSYKRFKDDMLGISGVSLKKSDKGRFYVGLKLRED
jgi:P4 family phage/plasmid primase-like protien